MDPGCSSRVKLGTIRDMVNFKNLNRSRKVLLSFVELEKFLSTIIFPVANQDEIVRDARYLCWHPFSPCSASSAGNERLRLLRKAFDTTTADIPSDLPNLKANKK
jgi:hypothetical protein